MSLTNALYMLLSNVLVKISVLFFYDITHHIYIISEAIAFVTKGYEINMWFFFSSECEIVTIPTTPRLSLKIQVSLVKGIQSSNYISHWDCFLHCCLHSIKFWSVYRRYSAAFSAFFPKYGILPINLSIYVITLLVVISWDWSASQNMLASSSGPYGGRN